MLVWYEENAAVIFTSVRQSGALARRIDCIRRHAKCFVRDEIGQVVSEGFREESGRQDRPDRSGDHPPAGSWIAAQCLKSPATHLSQARRSFEPERRKQSGASRHDTSYDKSRRSLVAELAKIMSSGHRLLSTTIPCIRTRRSAIDRRASLSTAQPARPCQPFRGNNTGSILARSHGRAVETSGGHLQLTCSMELTRPQGSDRRRKVRYRQPIRTALVQPRELPWLQHSRRYPALLPELRIQTGLRRQQGHGRPFC